MNEEGITEVRQGISIQPASYIPILSELIEACDELYFGIMMFYRFAKDYDDGSWIRRVKVTSPDTDWFNGKTFKEAVAKLWLNLNEK